jgi:hypothetical protein
LACSVAVSLGCGSSEPVDPPFASPSISVSRERAAAGSPIDITYRFKVLGNAQINRDYRVMVHVVNPDEERMWDDDHDPPTPTSQWKPGETIEYTRTVFVPVYPYVGDAAIYVGLYSTADQTRLALDGDDVGQRAYRVARVELLPQTENVFTLFKDGWNNAEAAADNPLVEWQWTKKDAILAFRNPKTDALFYLDLDSPGGEWIGAQQLEVALGDQVLDRFTLEPRQRALRKIPMTSAQLGSAELSELRISVDKTFVPAQVAVGTTKDTRVLGVRVFHAFVEAN